MRRGKWIIFGMLVALLAGCSGKKTEETFADSKNAESTDEKNTLDFVDAHGERYTVEINEPATEILRSSVFSPFFSSTSPEPATAMPFSFSADTRTSSLL